MPRPHAAPLRPAHVDSRDAAFRRVAGSPAVARVGAPADAGARPVATRAMNAGAGLLQRFTLGLAGANGPNARLPILFYHRVLPRLDPLQPRMPDARVFDVHMSTLANFHHPVGLDEGVRRLREGTLEPGSVCVTFDDGYRDNVDIALPILARHRVPCAFFVSTGLLDGGCFFNDRILEAVRRLSGTEVDLGWAGLGVRAITDTASRIRLVEDLAAALKRQPLEARDAACDRLASIAGASAPADLMMRAEDLRTLRRAGMTIGGHTTDHPILAAVAPEAARAQIVDDRSTLRAITGETPTWFAYPNGKPVQDYDASHVQMVRDAGYEGALSTAWGAATRASDPFQMPRISAWQTSRLHLAASLLRATLSSGVERQA